MLARRGKPPCHARPAGSAQSGMRPRVAQVRRPGGAGKGTSPALAALAEPGAPGRHAPLELSPEAEAKDPELAALLRKAGPPRPARPQLVPPPRMVGDKRATNDLGSGSVSVKHASLELGRWLAAADSHGNRVRVGPNHNPIPRAPRPGAALRWPCMAR